MHFVLFNWRQFLNVLAVHRIYYQRLNKIQVSVRYFIKLSKTSQFNITNLFLKAIKISKMSIEHEKNLTQSDLKDCKRKLFTNSDLRIRQATHSSNNLYKSAINKPPTAATHSKPGTTKKIKLKGRHQNEQPITPLKQSEIKVATSPKMSAFLRSPLQDKQINIPKQESINKSQFYSINETSQPKVKRFTSMFQEVQVLPSPQKKSLVYSRINKASAYDNSASKSQERKLSKSKKKIHFTVYQQKQKNLNKQPIQIKGIRTPVKQYTIPYRYDSSITIDLFQSNNKSKSKSKVKSNSKDRYLTSPSKKPVFSRDLMKSNIEQQNEDRINRTMQKLQHYKFVGEYIQRWQIMQKIQFYMQSNEPQCKWPLLIVDHIFNRLKQQDNFQASIRT